MNAGFADAVLAELEAEPDSAVFFHDYHLYLAPRLVRERRPETAARPLRAHPLAAARLLVRAAEPDQARDPRRAARPATSSASTRRAGARTSCARAWTSSAPTAISRTGTVDVRRSRDPRGCAAAVGRRRRVRRARRQRRPSWRSSSSSPPRGRSSSFCASTAPTRPRTSCADSGPSSSSWMHIPELHGRVSMLALLDPSQAGHPGVRRVPGRDPARGAGG